jgi:hypothetical protein
VTGKKASADWAGLCRIYVELDDPNHPLRCVPMNREAAIANAVRSGSFPVRGHRCIDGCAGDAFERIDNPMTPDAEVSVYMSTVTIKLPPPGISLPLPSAFSPSPRRIKYVDVEADRREVEAWIRENALPAGWISAASPTPEFDQRDAPPPRTEPTRQQPRRGPTIERILARFDGAPPANMRLCEIMRRCLAKQSERRTYKRALDTLRASKIAARRPKKFGALL